MKYISITIALFGAAVLGAQEKKPAAGEFFATPEENFEAAIIPVKTLTGDSFNRLSGMLAVFHAHYIADDQLRTILVYAPKPVVAQMRKVVEQLDQPGSQA